jgi:hypothetical protein
MGIGSISFGVDSNESSVPDIIGKKNIDTILMSLDCTGKIPSYPVS